MAGLALISAQAAHAQDEGGVHLTFGVTERLETSENAALSRPSSGRLTASITTLNFGLSSETRTQVLRFGLSGGLRFEDGAAAADPERFDHPTLDAFYSVTGANSSLVLQASAQRGPAAQAAPTADDPDPTGEGMLTTTSASAVLDLGTAGPLGLSLQVSENSATYGGAGIDPADTQTVSASVTGKFRFASGAEARLSAGQSTYEEDNDDELRRETTDLSLGWTQPLSSVLTLDAQLGQQRVDSFELGKKVDSNDGLAGHAGLSMELANGSAGVTFSQANEAYATRQTLSAERRLDLGNQSIAASLGATRIEDNSADMIGSLTWTYDGSAGALSLDVSRSIASDGPNAETRTDRLVLGLSRDLSPQDRLNLNLTAAHVNSQTDTPVRRTDLTASYSRDLGQDWAMSMGATLTLRKEDKAQQTASRLLFLSISRNFAFRP